MLGAGAHGKEGTEQVATSARGGRPVPATSGVSVWGYFGVVRKGQQYARPSPSGEGQ